MAGIGIYFRLIPSKFLLSEHFSNVEGNIIYESHYKFNLVNDSHRKCSSTDRVEINKPGNTWFVDNSGRLL